MKDKRPLEAELAAQRAQSAARIAPETQALMERATRELEADIWRMGLQVGERAPDFTLKSVEGQSVRLSGALQRGPAVLAFYRGQW